MHIISAAEIQSYFFRSDFDVLRIPTKLDITRIQKDVTEIIQSCGLKSKDQRLDYEGIGLQYHDESNPFYDAVDQFAYMPVDGSKHRSRPGKFIVKKNVFGEKLSYIYDEFAPAKLFRGRILNAKPNIKMQPHVDGKYVFNCHVPVFSNPQCKIHVEDRPYYLEPDGSLYVLNAQKFHHVENSSQSDRIHIVFTINFFSFKNWTKDIIDSYIAEIKIENRKQEIYEHYGIKA